MNFDIKKFFSGFNIFDGEKFGKILFLAIILAIGLAIYHQITRPTKNIKVEKGGVANIIENHPNRWGIGGNIQSDKTIGVSVLYLW